MAKLTVLEMVQDILNDLDSDEVNSINDTVEAVQIAQQIKTSYFELIGNRNWPHLKSLFQLTGLADATTPTHFLLPEDVKEIDNLVLVRYNKRKAADTRDKYATVDYLTPEGFLQQINGRNSSESNIQTVTDLGGANLYIRNDIAPSFWTSFDDEHLVFDAFDLGVDATLQTSKTQAVGFREPAFTIADSFIPDLPSEVFPALLAEAKSTAMAKDNKLNPKAEQKAQRQKRWLARRGWRVQGDIPQPDYGRRRHKQGTNKNPLLGK